MKPCQACLANVKTGKAKLCPACEKYANQDQVSQRETPMSDWKLEKLATNNELRLADLITNSDDNLEKFNRILRKGKLTTAEKDILTCRFVESLSFFETAKKLGISKGAASIQYQRGIKKLKKCMTFLPYMGETNVPVDDIKTHTSGVVQATDAPVDENDLPHATPNTDKETFKFLPIGGEQK